MTNLPRAYDSEAGAKVWVSYDRAVLCTYVEQGSLIVWFTISMELLGRSSLKKSVTGRHVVAALFRWTHGKCH